MVSAQMLIELEICLALSISFSSILLFKNSKNYCPDSASDGISPSLAAIFSLSWVLEMASLRVLMAEAMT